MKSAIPIFALALCAMPALAAEYSFDNEYLTPADLEEFDPESGYDQALRTAFKDLTGPDVEARAVGLPIYESEYAFALRRSGATYSAVYYLYPTSLWYASPGGLPTGGYQSGPLGVRDPVLACDTRTRCLEARPSRHAGGCRTFWVH